MKDSYLEYPTSTTLSPLECAYFMVPADIILQSDLPSVRIAVFSYLAIKRGIDFSINFSILDIVKWMNRKPNRHANGLNDQIRSCLEQFVELGYLSLSTPIKNDHTKIEATINVKTLQELTKHYRFAVLYTDEIRKIFSYSSVDEVPFCSTDNLLLVFSYLRMQIVRRQNALMPDERNMDNAQSLSHDIVCRRQRYPEVYNEFYNVIADYIQLSERTISTSVQVLHQLGLIYYEALPHQRYDDKNWRTDHTLFCNMYKREKNLLLAAGKDYYLPEIKNKKNLLANYKQNRKRNISLGGDYI